MSTAVTPKGERRRQALVEAAADLLLEGGFDAVRHRSVASRADLPLASTTYYFESLDDLIAKGVECNGNRALEVMRSRVEDVTHRHRGLESTVDLLLDLLVGPALMSVDCRERLISRYERFTACARRPELREVQRRLGVQLHDLLTEALRRSDRDVLQGQMRRLVAVVDGALVTALGEHDADPRALTRAILLDVVDVVAPAVDQPDHVQS
ncbi:TetR/AcrR family transcriptional regulator [Rhodococcus marinonascens]|uniref:TetR/AcrR family transcriptional regulator n=1 Tax=Rhodococcus marinonascens TaxID=38311 RepID=UPI0009334BF1|nr:TetR family transcriptional regulator [Rhodococcus marinonascens]